MIVQLTEEFTNFLIVILQITDIFNLVMERSENIMVSYYLSSYISFQIYWKISYFNEEITNIIFFSKRKSDNAQESSWRKVTTLKKVQNVKWQRSKKTT